MQERQQGEPLVSIQSVSKHFGEGETRVDALRDVSLDLYPGQDVALLGPSGSGKTTLLNIIGCILDPSSGRISLDGEPVYDGRWLRTDLRRLRRQDRLHLPVPQSAAISRCNG
jgi:putative ABC transport system ATP-binding protein